MRKLLRAILPAPIVKRLRKILRTLDYKVPSETWDGQGTDLWDLKQSLDPTFPHACNICHWNGLGFLNSFHCEMAECPKCGSVARDRFLLHSFLSRNAASPSIRILETSPRLGSAYRRMMRQHFYYVASDYDLSAHEGDIRIDLQDIALPDESTDIVLTPHVLEHVPDTKRALAEIHRILSLGGRMYLQVPLFHGSTRVPSIPEFHADNTPVFFNFGWDLTEQIRTAGFTVRVLVTQHFYDVLRDRDHYPTFTDPQFDVQSMWESIEITDLEIACDHKLSHRYGFVPPYQFVTWECIKKTAH